MRRAVLTIVAGIVLFAGGCASGLQGVGAGTSPSADAANCVAIASRIGVNLRVHETDRFLLVSSLDSASATATGEFLDEVHRRFYQSFSLAGFEPKPTPDKLICVCLDSYNLLDAYGREADGAEVSWMDAFYSHRTNRVAVVRTGNRPGEYAAVKTVSTTSAKPAAPGKIAALGNWAAGRCGPASLCLNLRTITHELAHQLAFNSGLQRRGAMYPFWLTEGLATNFEADFSGPFDLDQGDTCHRCRLIDAKAGRRLIPLEQFVGMTELNPAQSQSACQTYAQAWGLFGYLLKNHPRELKRYMAELSSVWVGPQDSESLRRRFVAIFGPVSPLERDFQAYIDRPLVASRTK